MIKFSEKLWFFFPENSTLQLSRFGNATFHTNSQCAAGREMLNGIWVAAAVGSHRLSRPPQRGSKPQKCILKELIVLPLESRLSKEKLSEYIAHSSSWEARSEGCVGKIRTSHAFSRYHVVFSLFAGDVVVDLMATATLKLQNDH